MEDLEGNDPKTAPVKTDPLRGFSNDIYNEVANTDKGKALLKRTDGKRMSPDEFFGQLQKSKRYALDAWDAYYELHYNEEGTPSRVEFLDFFFPDRTAVDQATKQAKASQVGGPQAQVAARQTGTPSPQAPLVGAVPGVSGGIETTPSSWPGVSMIGRTEGGAPPPTPKPKTFLELAMDEFDSVVEGTKKLFSPTPEPKRTGPSLMEGLQYVQEMDLDSNAARRATFQSLLEKDEDFGGMLEIRNKLYQQTLTGMTVGMNYDTDVTSIPGMDAALGPQKARAMDIANTRVEYGVVSSTLRKLREGKTDFTPAENRYLQREAEMLGLPNGTRMDNAQAIRRLDYKHRMLGARIDDISAGQQAELSVRLPVDNTVSAVERGANGRENAIRNMAERMKMGREWTYLGIEDRYERSKNDPNALPEGGVMSTIGEFVGGAWKPVAIGMAAGAVGSNLGKVGQLAATMGTTALEAGVVGFGMSMEMYYQNARNQGSSHQEAADIADVMSYVAAMTGVAGAAVGTSPAAQKLMGPMLAKASEKLGGNAIGRIVGNMAAATKTKVIPDLLDTALTNGLINVVFQLTENGAAMYQYADKLDVGWHTNLMSQAASGVAMPLAIGSANALMTRQARLKMSQEKARQEQLQLLNAVDRNEALSVSERAQLKDKMEYWFAKGLKREGAAPIDYTPHTKKLIEAEKQHLAAKRKEALAQGDQKGAKQIASQLRTLDEKPAVYFKTNVEDFVASPREGVNPQAMVDAEVEIRSVDDFNRALGLQESASQQKDALSASYDDLMRKIEAGKSRMEEMNQRVADLQREAAVVKAQKKVQVTNKLRDQVGLQNRTRKQVAAWENQANDILQQQKQLDTKITEADARVNDIFDWMGLPRSSEPDRVPSDIADGGRPVPPELQGEEGALTDTADTLRGGGDDEALRGPQAAPAQDAEVGQPGGEGGGVRPGGAGVGDEGLRGTGTQEAPAVREAEAPPVQVEAPRPVAPEPEPYTPAPERPRYQGPTLEGDGIPIPDNVPDYEGLSRSYSRPITMEAVPETPPAPREQRPGTRRRNLLPESFRSRLGEMASDLHNKLVGHYAKYSVADDGSLPLMASTMNTLGKSIDLWENMLQNYKKSGDKTRMALAEKKLAMARDNPSRFLIEEQQRYAEVAANATEGMDTMIGSIISAVADVSTNIGTRLAALETRVYSKGGLMDTYLNTQRGLSDRKAFVDAVDEARANLDYNRAEKLVQKAYEDLMNQGISKDQVRAELSDLVQSIEVRRSLAAQAKDMYSTVSFAPEAVTRNAPKPMVRRVTDEIVNYLVTEKNRQAKALAKKIQQGKANDNDILAARDKFDLMSSDPYGYFTSMIEGIKAKKAEAQAKIDRVLRGRNPQDLQGNEKSMYDNAQDAISRLDRDQKGFESFRRKMRVPQEEYEAKKKRADHEAAMTPTPDNPDPMGRMQVGEGADPQAPTSVAAIDNQEANMGVRPAIPDRDGYTEAAKVYRDINELQRQTLAGIDSDIDAAIKGGADRDVIAELQARRKEATDIIESNDKTIKALEEEHTKLQSAMDKMGRIMDDAFENRKRRREFGLMEQQSSSSIGKWLNDLGYSNMAMAYTGLLKNGELKAKVRLLDNTTIDVLVDYYRNVGGVLSQEYNILQFLQYERLDRMQVELDRLEAQGLDNTRVYDDMASKFLEETALMDQQRSTLGRMLGQIRHAMGERALTSVEMKAIKLHARQSGIELTPQRLQQLETLVKNRIDAEAKLSDARQDIGVLRLEVDSETGTYRSVDSTDPDYHRLKAEAVKNANDAYEAAAHTLLRNLQDDFPPRLLDVMKANIALGLMTPLSLSTNVVSNVTHAVINTLSAVTVRSDLAMGGVEMAVQNLNKLYASMRGRQATNVDLSAARGGGLGAVRFGIQSTWQNMARIGDKLWNPALPDNMAQIGSMKGVRDEPLRDIVQLMAIRKERKAAAKGETAQYGQWMQKQMKVLNIDPEDMKQRISESRKVWGTDGWAKALFTGITAPMRVAVSRSLMSMDEAAKLYATSMEAYAQAQNLARKQGIDMSDDLARMLLELSRSGEGSTASQFIRESGRQATFTEPSVAAKLLQDLYNVLEGAAEKGYREKDPSALVKIKAYVASLGMKGIQPFISVPANVAMHNLKLASPDISAFEMGIALRGVFSDDPNVAEHSARKFGQASSMFVTSLLLTGLIQSLVEDEVIIGEGQDKAHTSLIQQTVGKQAINMDALYRNFDKYFIKSVGYAAAQLFDTFDLVEGVTGKSSVQRMSELFDATGADSLGAKQQVGANEDYANYGRSLAFAPMIDMYVNKYMAAGYGKKGQVFNKQSFINEVGTAYRQTMERAATGADDGALSEIMDLTAIPSAVAQGTWAYASQQLKDKKELFTHLLSMQLFNQAKQFIDMVISEDESTFNKFTKYAAVTASTALGLPATLKQGARLARGYQTENKYLTSNADSFRNTIADALVIELIPMIKSLPDAHKLDPFGDEVQSKPDNMGIIRAMFDPIKYRTTTMPPHKAESLRLAQHAGAKAIPAYPPRTLTMENAKYSAFEGMKIELTPQEFEALNRATGKAQTAAFQQVMGESWYNGLSDKHKVSALSKEMRKAYSKAKDLVLEEYQEALINDMVEQTGASRLQVLQILETDQGMRELQERILKKEGKALLHQAIIKNRKGKVF